MLWEFDKRCFHNFGFISIFDFTMLINSTNITYYHNDEKISSNQSDNWTIAVSNFTEYSDDNQLVGKRVNPNVFLSE